MKLFKNLVRSLYKRLWREEFLQNKLKYKVSLLNPLLEQNWIGYYKNNNKEEKYNNLIKGLDKNDIALIDLILKRHKLYKSILGYENLIYINPDDFLTEKEKEEGKIFILSTDSDYLLNLCNKQVQYLTISPAQSTSAWGHFRKMLDSAPLALRVPLLQARSHSDNINQVLKKFQKYFPVQIGEPGVFCFHCGLKEIPFVADYIKGKDFIDGGAFIGDSAFMFEKFYKPNMVYTFEPLKINFDYINQTIKMNDLKHVTPVMSGIGDKEEESEISYNPEGLSGSSIIIKNKNNLTQKINVTTIDNFVSKNNLNLGLIKLDVEGFESNVIKGAAESIKKYRPVMLISIYHTPQDFFEIKPFIESLNLNYKFKIKKTAPQDLLTELMLIAYPAELENSVSVDFLPEKTTVGH